MTDRENRKISLHVVRRLPRYYRFFSEVSKKGEKGISSLEIGRRMGFTPSQVRQDFNCFGGFGQQGYGYNVEQLRREMREILNIDKRISAILVGVGNLGRALHGFISGGSYGISITGLFDINPKIASQVTPKIKIRNITELEEFCGVNKPEIAILCIPGNNAQQMAERLAKLGIKGFWNFSQADLMLPETVFVENVHLGDSLLTLNYLVNNLNTEKDVIVYEGEDTDEDI